MTTTAVQESRVNKYRKMKERPPATISLSSEDAKARNRNQKFSALCLLSLSGFFLYSYIGRVKLIKVDDFLDYFQQGFVFSAESVFFLMSLLCLIFSLYLFCSIMLREHLRKHLCATGKAAQATVIEARCKTLLTSKFGNEARITLFYRFTDSLGKSHKGKTKGFLRGGEFDIKEGDTITVYYDQRNPEKNIWEGG